MKFIYGRQDFKTFERGEENCYLMTNGLGGFSSMTIAGSCSRNDHALLMSCSAAEAPNHRYNMIHRLKESLKLGDCNREICLSTQDFTDHAEREEGYRYLSSFVFEDYPVWRYEVCGVEITRQIVMAQGENTVGVSYTVENRADTDVTLCISPQLEFVPKGELLSEEQEFKFMLPEEGAGGSKAGARGETAGGGKYAEAAVRSNGRELHFMTNGRVVEHELTFTTNLFYAYDACDDRRETGCTAENHSVIFEIPRGEILTGEIIYSTEPAALHRMNAQTDGSATECSGGVYSGVTAQMAESLKQYRNDLKKRAGLTDETAQALVCAANQFISYRTSTDKQTILAGFPFFEDWGRDTMISLVGCCISTGQYEVAESILRTFMMYCRKGLMPNLFPEGRNEPWYNTVDAALLFIITVYEYFCRTKDKSFVISAWTTMQEIVEYYADGTDFHIGMDEDGLIHAGGGYEQVTWMDVRINDILPTPRHGKPVEINAYWYNVLRIMDFFAGKFRGELSEASAGRNYADMAELAGRSFREKFWNAEAGCLKDVLTGGDGEGAKAETQIRCNQIWAVSLPFSLLERKEERQVVETVYRKLYTPLGLRTLDPADPEFKPFYGGRLMNRDLAYHQGTTWVFPLGGYYLAYLKVNDYSESAKAHVRAQLESITAALREGCIGQLPEIYDGERPVSSKGCFAQAWSVGEMLRVYEALERR